MKKQRLRFYNKLYFRFLCILGVAFSVLVVLIGIVFMRLYDQNVFGQYTSQLKDDAGEIADKIEEYVISNESSQYLNYMDAIESVLDSQMVDVWVMRYNKAVNKLPGKYVNVSLKYSDFSDGMKEIMKAVYRQDVILSNRSYDEIYDTELIRAASPIHDSGGNIIGGVLLNGVTQSRHDIIDGGKRIVIFAMLVAWVISIILAAFLARPLSDPISRIRCTALKLVNGKYMVKTGIKRRSGEIGELAETIDVLSDRLAENEEARNEIERGRMDFFANVSHELRTPITVIRGYTETLADGYVTDPEKLTHTFGRMLKECSGMERLVGDLLTISKVQNPDFEIAKEPVSVVQIFEDVTRSARILSEKKHIGINVIEDDQYGFMLGDYDRLRQMFLVIMDNAIKFSNDNSSIEVNIHREDNRLIISIRDNGVGIPEDVLPNIFNKFYKSKLQMNDKGSGLGLVIARHIAARHGGTIEVESKEGKGSCFTFTFDSIDPPEE